jgi:HrpA-like RNA helicase
MHHKHTRLPLFSCFTARRSSPEGAAMQAQRAKLPMSGLRQQLSATLAASDAVVVSGETGSGKTTQVCC